MNAIKKLRKYLIDHPDTPSSKTLSQLIVALGDETAFPLTELYQLDLESFELAIALLQDWRLDRYYASRLRLFDIAYGSVAPPAGQIG